MRKRAVICFVIILWLLSGCWDQHLLKDNSLVLGIGLDASKGEKIVNTAVIRLLKSESGGTGKPSSTNVLYSATGNTFRETRAGIEKQLGGEYAPNKLRVLVIGEELAGKDIYPILDILYRDPRNSLTAKLVVAQGTAKELLKIKKSKEVFISEKLLDVVNRSEERTLIPIETIQSICPDLFDPGKDFALPYVTYKGSDSIEIQGMALFHDKKFTGTIMEGEDATVLLYLNGEEGNVARFTLKVNPEEARRQNQFISISSFLKDHNLKVKVDKHHKISAEITLKINITAIEYPLNQLSKQTEINKLNKEISKLLTQRAEFVIKELQQANCDYFGIGRKVMAYHPETWKAINWADTFPTIDIKTKIETNITGTGIIK
ncbi:Ger(x)C family spore germination protein [Neobacillus sp. NRS-1170]|uniref:Ger(x)C family spore germination protein n=1 Tax=Neobacillus sp. NRS-1170 TaxID=3233898 RepID=UPI003D2870C7